MENSICPWFVKLFGILYSWKTGGKQTQILWTDCGKARLFYQGFPKGSHFLHFFTFKKFSTRVFPVENSFFRVFLPKSVNFSTTVAQALSTFFFHCKIRPFPIFSARRISLLHAFYHHFSTGVENYVEKWFLVEEMFFSLGNLLCGRCLQVTFICNIFCNTVLLKIPHREANRLDVRTFPTLLKVFGVPKITRWFPFSARRFPRRRPNRAEPFGRWNYRR